MLWYGAKYSYGVWELSAHQANTFLKKWFVCIVKGSFFGLIKVYNNLSGHVLDAKEPKLFQRRLQNMAKEVARANCDNWPLMFKAS